AARVLPPPPPPRPGPAPEGGAVRRARRDDARGDEPGAAARLGGAAQDHPLRHPFDTRGDPARRQCGRDDATARAAGARADRGAAAAAHYGPRVRSALQGGQRRGAPPDLRAARARAVMRSRVMAEYVVPALTLFGGLAVWALVLT